MYVIAGVSGNTGSAAATALLAQNKPVRVVVRDAAKGASWAARGAEVAVAAFEDTAALTKAFSGAEGVYVLIPPNAWNGTGLKAWRAGLRTSIMTALKAAQPSHVVALSSVGAQHTSGTGPIADLNPLEGDLRASGIPSTFVRAGYFMENWMASVQGALASGAVYNGLDLDKRFPQVATHDIGLTIADALLHPVAKGVRVIELGGPEDLSFRESVAILSAVVDKPLNPVQVPIAGQVQALMGMGASQEVADGYGELTDGVNKGLVAWEAQGAEARRGATSLKSFFTAALAKR